MSRARDADAVQLVAAHGVRFDLHGTGVPVPRPADQDTLATVALAPLAHGVLQDDVRVGAGAGRDVDAVAAVGEDVVLLDRVPGTGDAQPVAGIALAAVAHVVLVELVVVAAHVDAVGAVGEHVVFEQVLAEGVAVALHEDAHPGIALAGVADVVLDELIAVAGDQD